MNFCIQYGINLKYKAEVINRKLLKIYCKALKIK